MGNVVGLLLFTVQYIHAQEYIQYVHTVCIVGFIKERVTQTGNAGVVVWVECNVESYSRTLSKSTIVDTQILVQFSTIIINLVSILHVLSILMHDEVLKTSEARFRVSSGSESELPVETDLYLAIRKRFLCKM